MATLDLAAMEEPGPSNSKRNPTSGEEGTLFVPPSSPAFVDPASIPNGSLVSYPNPNLIASANPNPNANANGTGMPSKKNTRDVDDDEEEADKAEKDGRDTDNEDEDNSDDDEDDHDDDPPPRRLNANSISSVGLGKGKMTSISSDTYYDRWRRPARSLPADCPPGAGMNYLFYAGRVPSQPDHAYIQDFHEKWYGNWSRLEYEHGFIQWLFPVFESSGVNWDAEALTKSEAKLMRQDFTIATRVIRSYRLMLNFYGIRLVSEKTGEVRRFPRIWPDRFDNLNTCSHNNLRINRILTSLGELGFARYKKPLVDFFNREILENHQLPSCRHSLLNYWQKCLEVDTVQYRRKTLEDPEDREDSVFFYHMDNNTEQYQKWVEEEGKILAVREKNIEELEREDEAEYSRRAAERAALWKRQEEERMAWRQRFFSTTSSYNYKKYDSSDEDEDSDDDEKEKDEEEDKENDSINSRGAVNIGSSDDDGDDRSDNNEEKNAETHERKDKEKEVESDKDTSA